MLLPCLSFPIDGVQLTPPYISDGDTRVATALGVQRAKLWLPAEGGPQMMSPPRPRPKSRWQMRWGLIRGRCFPCARR